MVTSSNNYIIIKNSYPSYVEKEVNELIDKGYVCLGSIVINNGMIYQVMIKESK